MSTPNTRVIVPSLVDELRLDHVSREWESPSASEYRMVEYIPWPSRLKSLYHQLASGSMDVDIKVDGVTVASNSVGTSQSEIVVDLEVEAAVAVSVEASNLSSPERYSFTLTYEIIVPEEQS